MYPDSAESLATSPTTASSRSNASTYQHDRFLGDRSLKGVRAGGPPESSRVRFEGARHDVLPRLLTRGASKLSEGPCYRQMRWPVLVQVWQSTSQGIIDKSTYMVGRGGVCRAHIVLVADSAVVPPNLKEVNQPMVDPAERLARSCFGLGPPSAGSVRVYPLPLFYHTLSGRGASRAAGERENRHLEDQENTEALNVIIQSQTQRRGRPRLEPRPRPSPPFANPTFPLHGERTGVDVERIHGTLPRLRGLRLRV